jgi:hypothetical protein
MTDCASSNSVSMRVAVRATPRQRIANQACASAQSVTIASTIRVRGCGPRRGSSRRPSPGSTRERSHRCPIIRPSRHGPSQIQLEREHCLSGAPENHPPQLFANCRNRCPGIAEARRMTCPSPGLRRRQRSNTPRATDEARITGSIWPPSPVSCKPTATTTSSRCSIRRRRRSDAPMRCSRSSAPSTAVAPTSGAPCPGKEQAASTMSTPTPGSPTSSPVSPIFPHRVCTSCCPGNGSSCVKPTSPPISRAPDLHATP